LEKKKALKADNEFYDLDLANHIFRNYGDEALSRYRRQFIDEEDEDNLPRIQFFDGKCPVIIDTIPVAVYDEKKTEDIKEFNGDDPLDNFRYLCKAVNRYCDGLTEELKMQKLVQDAVARLNVTQNQTQFYRQMEAIESKRKSGMVVRKSRLGRRH